MFVAINPLIAVFAPPKLFSTKLSLQGIKYSFMDTYTLPADISVFGILVENFPNGVGDAFGAMMQQIADGKSRAYYGISSMDAEGRVKYYAAAEEKLPDEAALYGYEKYTIEQGEYLTVTVQNWRTKTDCIKDVFHELMQDKRVDHTKPCVEWYKSDDEMICMLKVEPVKELFTVIDKVATELLDILQSLSEQQLNAIPFKDSWTAAQLATHVTKSNKAMAQAMEMQGVLAERDPAERAAQLKNTFLNFDIKFQSPDFIVPGNGSYRSEAVVAALKKSNLLLRENAAITNLAEMIQLPALGEMTKMELLYFVLYHTQRHIYQLKQIVKHLASAV